MSDHLSTRGKVLACVMMSLVLSIAFSSETSMARPLVHPSKSGVKGEEQGTEMIREDGFFQESKLTVSGSSSRPSRHGNNRGRNGG
ncbi:hypothetical protein LINGRAHAP2_LOCUS12767 [Linum grandiflorum]